MSTELQKICRNAQAALSGYAGSFIEKFSHFAARETYCDISLVKSGGSGEATISLEEVRYLSISNAVDLDGGAFVDEVLMTYLPSDGSPWPSEANRLVSRFPGLPALVWVRLTGPVEVDVVAAIMTVSFSVDLTLEPDRR